MDVTYPAILQENILSLHVSMEDLAFMQVEECKRHLNKPIQNLIFCKVLAFASFDFAVNITAIAIHHHDV